MQYQCQCQAFVLKLSSFDSPGMHCIHHFSGMADY
ncbi:hypothetical protein A3768_5443 (plasmid) [Ralstonia solanacearum]|nr:hypothetical protein A3768_5443 [Ralstonia solanacearum]